MKTSLVAVTLAFALCSAVSAQPAPTSVTAPAAPKAPFLPPMRKADPAALSNMLAKTGGILSTPASGPSILFLNAQTRVPGTAVREPLNQIEKLLRLPCVVRDQPSAEPVAAAVKSVADANVAAVIVIGDSTGYPPLLLAPENRWALVNVAALGGADVPADRLADRLQKEIVRAFGMLLGSACSTSEGCVLKPVLRPEDLDALKAKNLSVEPMNKILSYVQRLGVKPSRMTTYRKAVEEGWAPAPTNDFQRAIWREVKK